MSATIQATAAQLFVADISRSCGYFVERLGFSVAFTYGEPPFFAQVRRDGGIVNLRCVEAPVIDPALRRREELLSSDMALASADDLRRLFAEFEAKGAIIFQPPRVEPWGAHTFIVEDPDGNLLLFAAPAD